MNDLDWLALREEAHNRYEAALDAAEEIVAKEPIVTAADRRRCFLHGHDVTGWGTIAGWCKRCQHSVWTYDGKSVWQGGHTHRYPPKHSLRNEASLYEMGYRRHRTPERAARSDDLPVFSRSEALAMYGREDDYLRARGLL